MLSFLKRVLQFILTLGGVVLAVAAIYVIYLLVQYNRIEDGAVMEIINNQAAALHAGEEYTALSYNIGFGAYDTDFSFFMDEGIMQDGTVVQGEHARAVSKQVVESNLNGAIGQITRSEPDIVLLQEVDTAAHRSFHINQDIEITNALPAYGSVFASNFHSAYLPYPFTQPHGAVQSGILTMTRFEIDSAVRRSFPVDESFPAKFFDLDRCFTVQRLPVEEGGELVLINLHLSAYDEGGRIRAAQLDTLCEVLEEERKKGNWVIAGGDFNHALCGTLNSFAATQQQPEWIFPFDDSVLPDGFSVVCPTNKDTVPTVRGADIPYQPGVSYTSIVDGFIVSDSVKAAATNIDAAFEFSDHNPVELRFKLS